MDKIHECLARHDLVGLARELLKAGVVDDLPLSLEREIAKRAERSAPVAEQIRGLCPGLCGRQAQDLADFLVSRTVHVDYDNVLCASALLEGKEISYDPSDGEVSFDYNGSDATMFVRQPPESLDALIRALGGEVL